MILEDEDVAIQQMIRTLAVILISHAVAGVQEREVKIPYTPVGRAVIDAFVQKRRTKLISENAIFADLPPMEVTYDEERRPEIHFKVVS